MNIAKYILRFLYFILKYVVIIGLVLSILVIGYVVVKDTANVYIITTEGMEARAGNVLDLEDSDELFNYFTGNYIAKDIMISSTTYDEFFIRDFDYKLTINSIWCNPWELTADVEVIEDIIEIDGEYVPKEDDPEGTSRAIPAWQRRRYAVKLISLDGAWMIDDIVLLENMPPNATPTDEPVLSPTPEGMTPSPSPTATVSASN